MQRTLGPRLVWSKRRRPDPWWPSIPVVALAALTGGRHASPLPALCAPLGRSREARQLPKWFASAPRPARPGPRSALYRARITRPSAKPLCRAGAAAREQGRLPHRSASQRHHQQESDPESEHTCCDGEQPWVAARRAWLYRKGRPLGALDGLGTRCHTVPRAKASCGSCVRAPPRSRIRCRSLHGGLRASWSFYRWR